MKDNLCRFFKVLVIPPVYHNILLYKGAVRLMRTRIRLLAQPEPMRSIVGATQQEQLVPSRVKTYCETMPSMRTSQPQ